MPPPSVLYRPMKKPTISQYALSVAFPRGLARTLGAMEAELDAHGNVRLTAGGNAAVFRVRDGGSLLALKCYTKPGRPDPRVYDYLSSVSDTFLSPARVLRDELLVFGDTGDGARHDVVVSEWAEGFTLKTEIKRAVCDYGPARLRELSDTFEDMARELLAREWAHGDLKPENIVVRPDGSMCLIDYDAMYVPAMEGERAIELGTPGFSHPVRTEEHFCKNIDDYQIALIAVGLRALALDPTLYGTYGRADNMLMDPGDVIAGGSEAYDRVLALFARHGDRTGYELASLLRSESPYLPALRRILGAGEKTGACKGALQLFERGGLWGYCDAAGEVAIEAIYEEATDFAEGLAAVRLNGVAQIIDEQGRAVTSGEYDTVKPYSEGLAAVERDGLWGYIGRDGRQAVAPRFEMACSMHEGRAAVRSGGKWGYIDRDGKQIIEPVYDHASGFRNGRATVHLNGDVFFVEKA